MPQSSTLDPTLLGTFMAFAALWISVATFYFTIPHGRRRLIIFIVTNFVTWALINFAIYIAINPKSAAWNAILISNIILMTLMLLGLLIYYILSRHFALRSYLPRPNSPDLSYGLNHIDNVIIPFYMQKNNVTLNDKKDAMSAVLRQISLTTVPTTMENLTRMGIFEVKENGHFRILATHHIDAHRIPRLEREFSHQPECPKSMVGHTVIKRKSILIPDFNSASEEQRGFYHVTDENRLPGQKAEGILCVPVFDNSIVNHDSKCLAVISVSCSRRNFLTQKHVNDIEQYAGRVRTILLGLNSKILFDPEVSFRFRAITVSGEVGSGKTTLVSELSSILGWNVISVGQKFREFCDQNRITIDDYSQIPDEIHLKFDENQKQMLAESDSVIFDGRLSGWLARDMKDVLTVYCQLPLSDRVNRLANRSNISPEDAEVLVRERDTNDLERYKKLYNLNDYRDKKFYKLYLITNEGPYTLAQKVIEAMKAYKESIAEEQR